MKMVMFVSGKNIDAIATYNRLQSLHDMCNLHTNLIFLSHCFSRFIESGHYLGFMDSQGQKLLGDICKIPDKNLHQLRVFTSTDFAAYSKKMDSKTGEQYNLNKYCSCSQVKSWRVGIFHFFCFFTASKKQYDRLLESNTTSIKKSILKLQSSLVGDQQNIHLLVHTYRAKGQPEGNDR